MDHTRHNVSRLFEEDDGHPGDYLSHTSCSLRVSTIVGKVDVEARGMG